MTDILYQYRMQKNFAYSKQIPTFEFCLVLIYYINEIVEAEGDSIQARNTLLAIKKNSRYTKFTNT